jgi:hypothetical protein
VLSKPKEKRRFRQSCACGAASALELCVMSPGGAATDASINSSGVDHRTKKQLKKGRT